MKTTKTKKRLKRLKNDSTNHKIFCIIAYLINETAKKAGKEIKDLHDLFWEYSTTSIMQKVHGTYYANLEDSMPTGKEMKQAAITKAINELESLNYIKIKKCKSNNQKLRVSITKKGALEFLKYRIEKKKKKKWDGKWRIIIFDILENQRKIRDLLRSRLRWFGFKELQKSAWIFPYDVKQEIETTLDVCNVDIIGDVKFLTVEEMTDDEDLKREFGLNN